MRKKGAYRAVDVKEVRLERTFEGSPDGAVTVGLDIGKREIMAVLRWSDGTFERPWRTANPLELRLLVRLLREMADRRPLIVAMESTGTYGDALRQALSDAQLDLRRVGGKAAADYAEIFDGVPSQHDGKDAAIVAELTALGKAWPWPARNSVASDAEMAAWVDWLDAQQSIEMLWVGRLEGLLARHWPEATRLLDLTSVTLLQALAQYGGPQRLSEDDQAATRLASWGRGPLTAAKIQRVIRSAAETVGVRQGAPNIQTIKRYATRALSAYRETQRARKKLIALARDNAVIQRQAAAVGAATACVLWVCLGDPRDYHCAEAYRKAMGLNLKERSSGRYKGRLKITKRGPSIVRRWLYFAAMRASKKAEVRPWYEAKKAKDADRGKGALIGVARRLALALHGVATRDEPFEPWRLFPGKSQACRSLKQSAATQTDTTEQVNRCSHGGPAPRTPRDLSLRADPGDEKERGAPGASSPVSAPGSALGSRPRVALSSAQSS